MDGGKSKLGKVHVPYKGVLTAGFYGSMSVSSVFINKAIFKGRWLIPLIWNCPILSCHSLTHAITGSFEELAVRRRHATADNLKVQNVIDESERHFKALWGQGVPSFRNFLLLRPTLSPVLLLVQCTLSIFRSHWCSVKPSSPSYCSSPSDG